MAFPASSVRLAPAGFKMDDGFPTKISLENDTNIEFWEKTVQPTGYDGGDAIPTSTMHNTIWRTMFPRSLKTLTESIVTAAYDPLVMDSIEAQINRNQGITIHYPDNSTYTFWGFMQKFIPQTHTEGEQPEAEITFVPTNYDSDNCVEADPVLVSYGTCNPQSALHA